MSEKKIYLVNVEVSFEMAVAASSRKEAEKIAEDNYEEDLRDIAYPGTFFTATEMKSCPSDFRGCLPWGPEDDDPRRNWPVDKWFEEKTE